MEPEEKPTPSSTGAEFGRQVAELVPGQKAGGGRYTLIKFLGKGGMGIVWLARDEHLRDDVALKFLPAEIHHDVEALEDMRRETLRSRKLSHPNIIRIHDLHVVPGESPFISMEYIPGAALNVLKAQQPQRMFSWEYLKPIIKQLCDALDYAHQQKVIHRDLKPANMMLTTDGVLKLADFGIAAVASDSMSRVSLKHSTSGTVVYMSPQQMNGQKPQPADDIYALGATVYELLTSKPPFYTGDIMHQVQNLAPLPMEQRLADLKISNEIPPEVSAMVMACLAKDPEPRPSSARAVADWIGLTIRTAPTRERAAWAGAAGSARRKGLMAAGAAVMLIVIIALWAHWQGGFEVKSPEDFKLEEGWAPLFKPGAVAYGANDAKLWRRTPDGNLIGIGTKNGGLRELESFTNFQFKAEVWLEKGASGLLQLRTTGARPREIDAYRVVLGHTQNGQLRTGSVLNFSEIHETLVPDQTWFELHAVLIGNRIVVRINQRIVADCRDPLGTNKSGLIVLIHKPGPPVTFRRLRVRPLPADEAAAWSEVHKAVPSLP